MAQLVWDKISERTYETGVEKGVLYIQGEDGSYGNGEAWNGLINVTETPSGAEPSPFFANNKKYLNILSLEELSTSITAYDSPESFDACDGMGSIAPGVVMGQQIRKSFGLCYKTLYGNDTKATEYGYKIHLVYGCMASPSERAYNTANESPEPIEFSWECTTTPIEGPTGTKPSSIVIIDSTTADPTKLKALEDILYGTADTEPRLPLPTEVSTLLGEAAG